MALDLLSESLLKLCDILLRHFPLSQRLFLMPIDLLFPLTHRHLQIFDLEFSLLKFLLQQDRLLLQFRFHSSKITKFLASIIFFHRCITLLL
jgi:hypothetical protein